jgi:multidrug resistance efflux pump
MLKRLKMIGLLALASLPAQAEIFKCTDAAGHVMYSNVASKGCTKMNLEPISTIPAASKAAPKTPSPAGFPRVEENTQKARDNDRRKILEQEQSAEQKNLEEAKKKLAEAEVALPQERMQGGGINQAKVQERTQPIRDQIQLHERNLEAIRKELQNLR